MSRRSIIISLGIIGLLLLFVLFGMVYPIVKSSPWQLLSGGVKNTPSGAIFVPRQAPVMISLLVNPDRLEQFSKLNLPLQYWGQSQQEFEELKESILRPFSLSYRRDIQSWLGEEMTLAITDLDFDRTPQNGVQPGYLLAVTTSHPQEAKEFLQFYFAQQAISSQFELKFEAYQGVNLIHQIPKNRNINTPHLSSAVVGNFVLFANHQKVIRSAINNVQAIDLNLNNSHDYQNAVKTFRNPHIATAFINLPSLSAWIGQKAIPESPNIDQMLTLGLAVKRQGISAEIALLGVQGKENQPPTLSQPVTALKYLPADSLMIASGLNLKQFWQDIETGLNPQSPLSQLIHQTVKSIEKPFKINLSESIFSWVKGEYALALVPQNRDKTDWVFIAETTPEVDSQAIMNQLDTIAQEQKLSLGGFSFLDTPITAWTKYIPRSEKNNQTVKLNTEIKGLHTHWNNYEILATSLSALGKVIQPDNFYEMDKFQQAITHLPSENDGYLYLDWKRSQPLLQKFPIIRFMEFIGHPLFNHLDHLVLSSQGCENGVRRSTLLLGLSQS